MNVDEDLAVEVAEEADLSLNASLADSQSNFGDIRYRLIFVKCSHSSTIYIAQNLFSKYSKAKKCQDSMFSPSFLLT